MCGNNKRTKHLQRSQEKSSGLVFRAQTLTEFGLGAVKSSKGGGRTEQAEGNAEEETYMGAADRSIRITGS